jgi:ATP-dependent RNA helicase DeaD
VVVGTPGRLLDLIDQRIVRLNKCAFFVLDEADEMFSMGFFEDVRTILSYLPAKRQGMFVSATVTPRVTMLSDSFLNKAEKITVDEMGRDLPSIEHCCCEVGSGVMSKPDALCDLLEVLNPASAIIFCNTRSDTDLLDVVLRRRGFNARKLNSELTQKRRQIIMQKIRSGELRFMVATDIAARGLDIEQIETVFNYAVHDEPEVYLHRTGRTGRAGRSGRAISLIGPQDRLPFRNVRRLVEVEFKELPLPNDEEVSKARLLRVQETLKRESVEADTRDLLTAAMLLAETGVRDPNEDTVRMVGRFCSHLLQSQAAQEATELDEEHEQVEQEERPQRRGRSSQGGRSGGRQGTSRGRSRHSSHRR